MNKMKKIKDLMKEITMIVAVKKRMKIMKLSSYTGVYQYDLLFYPDKLEHDVLTIYIYHMPSMMRICSIHSTLEEKKVRRQKKLVKTYVFGMHFYAERELDEDDLNGIIEVLENILKTVRNWR